MMMMMIMIMMIKLRRAAMPLKKMMIIVMKTSTITVEKNSFLPITCYCDIYFCFNYWNIQKHIKIPALFSGIKCV